MEGRVSGTDSELVSACLAGDREAFAQIVERYQRLLCSLAYASTGDLGESEDIAQEAFVTAWQQLDRLREPDKLRPWLCTILRHRVGRSFRRDRKDPARQAEVLSGEEAHAGENPCVAEAAMRQEEQQLLWHALEGIPPEYREPLILYYREERSVRHVAEALELTDSAVKQRLTRGRKMLRERMVAFVEGALEKSAPGPVFTASVIAAVATLGMQGEAAAAGATGTAATKAGMTVKTTSLAALLASISGVVSTLFTVRANLDQARTARERRNAIWVAVALLGSFVLVVLAVLGLRWSALAWPVKGLQIALLAQAIILAFCAGWTVLLFNLLKRTRRLRGLERRLRPEAFADPRDRAGSKAGDYISKSRLLGFPLFHFRLSTAEEGSRPVVAWVAGGDRAYGLLFAWGAFAVAPFSIGAVSIGLFSLGAVSLGIFCVGSIGFGPLVLGAMGYGYIVYASLSAVGWQLAQGGGFAIARWFAEGSVAFAEHANDAAARAYLASPHEDFILMALLVTVSLLVIGPAILYARAVRRRLGR